jgi:DNA-binding XRE family transcriptional regulator
MSMKLIEYLKMTKTTQREFAKMTGITEQTIYNILHRKRDMRISIAAAIIHETKGQVSLQDLLPQEIAATYKDAAHNQHLTDKKI